MIENALLFIRLALFGVFAIAGIGKLLDLRGSEKAMESFGVPGGLTKPIGTVLPLVEIAIAYLLLSTATSWFGAIAATILLGAFIAGMTYRFVKGESPDCHCFGQVHSEPVGLKSIIRNVLLAALSLGLVLAGYSFQGTQLGSTPTEMIQSILLATLVAIGIVLLAYAKSIKLGHDEIRQRLQGGSVGMSEFDLSPVEREDAGDPNDGLAIGSPMPQFRLETITGETFGREQMLKSGMPTMFFFVGQTCSPCEVLMPEIAEWEDAYRDRVKFVFVSSGDLEKNREKFGGDDARIVALDSDRAFALSMYAKWTPTALFVDARGKLASHPAAGDAAIRRLFEQLKQKDLNDEFLFFLGLNGYGRTKIGQKVPDFSAIDIHGSKVSAATLVGKKTLVAYVSKSCPHCSIFLEQLRERREAKLNADVNFLLLFDELSDDFLRLDVRLIPDASRELMRKFGLRGVPVAILVNEDGRIVSENAIGPPHMWALLGETAAAA